MSPPLPAQEVSQRAKTFRDLKQRHRRLKAEEVVSHYVAVSMALGLLPMPGVDLLTLSAAQLRMLQQVCQLYGVTFRENLGKSALSAFLSALIPVKASVTLATLLKVFPGLGHLAGGISVSLLAGALTYASGQIFIRHFESGGTLLDFYPHKVVRQAHTEFRQGLKQVRRTQQKSPSF